MSARNATTRLRVNVLRRYVVSRRFSQARQSTAPSPEKGQQPNGISQLLNRDIDRLDDLLPARAVGLDHIGKFCRSMGLSWGNPK